MEVAQRAEDLMGMMRGHASMNVSISGPWGQKKFMKNSSRASNAAFMVRGV
jgi:hypothetical protein